MAVKDGLAYLPEQISSILNQTQCRVNLLISDDLSSDGSAEFLQRLSARTQEYKLIAQYLKPRSAAKNFFSLINKVDAKAFDFFAFADQDDIWFPDKLTRHIQLAQANNADGVSSNVIAFWPDGRGMFIGQIPTAARLRFSV